MGEPFHNHLFKNLSGWWLMIESKNHWKVPPPLPTSFICFVCGGRRKCAPLGIWRTLVRSRFTISGCERECVQRLMRRKYSDFYSFSLWGGEIFLTPIETEHYSDVSESEASCLTILVLVWEARRDKEKQGLATRSVSYNHPRKHCLPSFSLYLL